MRTTLNLADDVIIAIDRMAQQTGAGRSAVVNDLVRRGLRSDAPSAPVTFPAASLGVPSVNLDNIGEVLDLLDAS